MTDAPSPQCSSGTGYTEPQGYAASLRQQAKWVRECKLDGTIDADELDAAAAFIDRVGGAAQPSAEPSAWLYEMAFYIKPADDNPFRDWKQVVTIAPPPSIPKDGVRNIVPLYASPPAALPAGEDIEHPDCTTDRERELYDALMGLASAITSRQGWSKWVQGGVQIAPIVRKALRLDNPSLSSTDREGSK